jgi:outer membrane protein assembly factor BamD (BamD/ComL family)
MLRDVSSHAIHKMAYVYATEAYARIGVRECRKKARKILTSTMLDEKDFTCQGALLSHRHFLREA